MLSKTLEESLHRALAHANARRHEFATLEHLLLSLTEDRDAVAVLRACSVDIDKLRSALESFLDGETAGMGADGDGTDATPTASFQRVIQRAVHHVQMSGREEVTGANVLVAVFSEREIARGLFHAPAGHDPPRCGELHQPRDREGARHVRNADAEGRGRRGGGRREGREAGHRGARRLLRRPQPQGGRGAHRPADRPRRRSRAHRSGAVPADQEQPAVRRRPRRRQDRHRRGTGRSASSTARCPPCSRKQRSSRSTWERCSRGRATAAISRSG